MFTAVPVVHIICRRSGHDAPDEAHGNVAGQVGRDHRTEGVDRCVYIHFSVEKPEEGNIQKGRPIPGQGEFRPFSQSELIKMFQVAIGVGADELAPEMFIGVDFRVGDGGGDRWFWFDGKRTSALVAKFRVFLILLLTLRTGFHPAESITMKRHLGKEAASCFH